MIHQALAWHRGAVLEPPVAGHLHHSDDAPRPRFGPLGVEPEAMKPVAEVGGELAAELMDEVGDRRLGLSPLGDRAMHEEAVDLRRRLDHGEVGVYRRLEASTGMILVPGRIADRVHHHLYVALRK